MAPRRGLERSWRYRSHGRATGRPSWRIRTTMRVDGACSIFSITTRTNRGRPRSTTSCAELHRVLFAGPDLVGLAHRQHEHASVADFAGARRLNDRFDRVVGDRVGDDYFNLHLRQQAHVVFLASV